MSGMNTILNLKLTQATLIRHALLSGCFLLLAACTTAPTGPTTPAAQPPAQQPIAAQPLPREPLPPVATAAQIETLRQLTSARDRLYRVAAPLLVNNAELCRNHARKLLGFRASNRYSYPAELVAAAHTVLQLNDRLRVNGVLAGSGAERAGIRSGDELLSVEDWEFPSGAKAEAEAAALLGPLVANRSSLKLTILREAQPTTLDIPLTEACAFNIEVGNTDLVNAYGDGYRVLITRGMLQAIRDDEELAYVVAKEMAHNVLGHAARHNQQATAGGIIDNLVRLQPDLRTMGGTAGLRPMAPEFDTAADRLSIYMLARAGYKLERVVPFWRRLAKQYPPSMQNAYNALHPAIDRRMASMEKAVRDIRKRRESGRPLIPAP